MWRVKICIETCPKWYTISVLIRLMSSYVLWCEQLTHGHGSVVHQWLSFLLSVCNVLFHLLFFEILMIKNMMESLHGFSCMKEESGSLYYDCFFSLTVTLTICTWFVWVIFDSSSKARASLRCLESRNSSFFMNWLKSMHL